jgi:hypothetical protein
MITLIVEDGTKVVGANSYLTLAEAEGYHSLYGNTDWADAADDEVRKQALVLATKAVDLLYGSKYLSFMYPDSNQPLLFPRAYFWDNTGRIIPEHTIPLSLKDAVSEIALMQINGANIFPMQSTSGLVKSDNVKLGSLGVVTDYIRAPEGETFDGFRKIDILMLPLLRKPGNWSLKA